jgi:hypothetical protein
VSASVTPCATRVLQPYIWGSQDQHCHHHGHSLHSVHPNDGLCQSQHLPLNCCRLHQCYMGHYFRKATLWLPVVWWPSSPAPSSPGYHLPISRLRSVLWDGSVPVFSGSSIPAAPTPSLVFLQLDFRGGQRDTSMVGLVGTGSFPILP